jgi:hypothetical protein
MFKKENCLNSQFYSSLKNEVRTNNNVYDESIKKMSDELIKMINSQKKEDICLKKKK